MSIIYICIYTRNKTPVGPYTLCVVAVSFRIIRETIMPIIIIPTYSIILCSLHRPIGGPIIRVYILYVYRYLRFGMTR